MYRQDKEYMAEVGHLIDHPKLQKLKDIPHHIHSNRLEHSIHVSYTSYRISKKWAGIPKVRLGELSFMTSFTMTGVRSSLIRVMLGYIHE